MEQVILKNGRSCNWKAPAENRIHPGGHKIVSDTDGLFTHPLRRTPSLWKITNIVTETTSLDNFSSSQQYPAIINTGAKMEHRRNTNSFTHLTETRTTMYSSRFRSTKTVHTSSNCTTASGQHDYIVFDQLFDDWYVFIIELG